MAEFAVQAGIRQDGNIGFVFHFEFMEGNSDEECIQRLTDKLANQDDCADLMDLIEVKIAHEQVADSYRECFEAGFPPMDANAVIEGLSYHSDPHRWYNPDLPRRRDCDPSVAHLY